MRFQSHGGTLSHPPCEKPRMCRMSGRKIRKSTFSLLERALLDEDWMHLFDSARPSSHHYHEIQTSSPRSFFVSESSRAWQPLSPPGFDPTLARSKQHRRRRCSPPRRRRCCPGAKVFSPARPERRFLKAPMFIKLPLVLSGSSEDSAESEDHDDTSQKRNATENQDVDTKEPMKAFHAFFSCHALNLRDLGQEHLWLPLVRPPFSM